MSQESKRTYTIRLPETVAARVEKQAATSGVAPTTLIQSLVVDTWMAPPKQRLAAALPT